MTKLCFFDTNFIFSHKEISFYAHLKDADITLITSELVADELKGQNQRTIKKVFDCIHDSLNNEYARLYFKKDIQNFSINIDEANRNSDKKVDDFLEHVFGKSIIGVSDKTRLFDTLVERHKKKTSPFSLADNASVKGSFDTLIWVSFCDYCEKHKSEYDKFYFVTNDKAFNPFSKVEDSLGKEFEVRTGKTIHFLLGDSDIKLLEGLGVVVPAIQPNDDSKSTKVENVKPNSQKVADNVISDEMVVNVQKAIHDLLYVEDIYDSWGNMTDFPVFSIDKPISTGDVILLCETLESDFGEYVFYESIDIVPMLAKLGYIAERKYMINSKSVKTFVDLFRNIDNEYNDFLQPFIRYLTDEINKFVIVKSSDDLPF